MPWFEASVVAEKNICFSTKSFIVFSVKRGANMLLAIHEAFLLPWCIILAVGYSWKIRFNWLSQLGDLFEWLWIIVWYAFVASAATFSFSAFSQFLTTTVTTITTTMSRVLSFQKNPRISYIILFRFLPFPTRQPTITSRLLYCRKTLDNHCFIFCLIQNNFSDSFKTFFCF